MTFPIGQNPGGKTKKKEFRDALRKQLFALMSDPFDLPKAHRRLDAIAMKLVKIALESENPVLAIKEIADRIDGRVPQALIGDKDEDPIEQNVTVNFVG